MRFIPFTLVLLLAASVACASNYSTNVSDPNNNGPSFEQQVMDRPLPMTEAGRIRDCNWIRYNIARQESAAKLTGEIMGDPMLSAATEAVARQHIAILESRAAEDHCTAAFSSNPTSQQPSDQQFKQCFDRCQRYTDMTQQQCFESCNK